MTQYILKNLTNGPQMVEGVRIGARATTEPMELSETLATQIARLGIFRVSEAGDPFADLDDDAVRVLYETTTGKKPGRMGRAKMIEALNG